MKQKNRKLELYFINLKKKIKIKANVIAFEIYMILIIFFLSKWAMFPRTINKIKKKNKKLIFYHHFNKIILQRFI